MAWCNVLKAEEHPNTETVPNGKPKVTGHDYVKHESESGQKRTAESFCWDSNPGFEIAHR